MHYIVQCLDRAGAGQDRLAHIDAHRAHNAASPIKIVIGGPIVADDNQTMIGSFFVFEASSKDEVVAVNAADPFNKHGVWRDIQIHPLLKRIDNR